jgi:hypothetical protein
MSNVATFPNKSSQFVPGKSGNPGGRTADEWADLREARALATKNAPRAVLKLVALLDCGNAAVEKSAADSILDRAGVKVIKGLELADNEGNSLGYIVVPHKNGTLVTDAASDPVPGSD